MGKESRSDRDRDRRRSRSRDKDREREKDRDREKDRERDRDNRRNRDRKRSRSRDRDRRERSRSPKRRREEKERDRGKEKERDSEKDSKNKNVEQDELAIIGDKQKLEKEMQLRREKVEAWRAKKMMKAQREQMDSKKEADAAEKEREQKEKKIAEEDSKKKWSLEDEDDDEPSGDPKDMEMKEDRKAVEEQMEVDEIDPLDAFMADIRQQVKKPEKPKGVRVVTLKSTEPEKKKGEIMETEDNTDIVVDDFDLQKATASLTTKGRLLPQTDHEKVYYKPFRKNFYTETSEIARMAKKEVDAYREEMDDMKVRGKDCPKPIKTWAQSGVDAKTYNMLKKLNYAKPTSIQTQAIPAIMSGRDVIGIAKTGSGKTLAFLLPMFRHILDQDPLEEMDGPIAVIMAPTRELAMQTWKEANRFAKILNLTCVCVYGGVGISEQIADLKRGAEIIVCTPGRMIDMLAANNGKVTNLRRCTYLVLDEADRMFDMGFEPQVMKVVNNIRPDRQTVLFSATFPRQMEALARKILDKPVEIQVGGKSVVCDDIAQHALICDEHQKFLKLLELLGIYYEQGNVIVFVDKQEKADDVVVQLMRSGYTDCAPLHGAIDQFDRDSTITDFKNGRIKLLVATSVAARGLDVKKLILVVNYDCPNHYEDYVHRVGRTGRAGNKGYAYTFILSEGQEKMAGEVCRAFETAGKTPPADLVALWEKFKTEMAAEGKEVHLGGRGFSGSGYKYDDAEAEATANKKNLAKLVAGMEAGEDDDDDEFEQRVSSLMKSTKRVVDGQMPSGNKDGVVTGEVESKVEIAKALAAKIAATRNLNAGVEKDAAQLTAEAVMKGDNSAPIELSAKNIAQQIAEKINSKLNYIGDNTLPTTSTEHELQYYEEELEINDFPQQVRYRICSRDSLAQVIDYADVGISVRGTHYPNNKEPKNGERKLFLFLEARSELNLRRAKEEILRIMKEAFRQLAANAARNQPQGRYKVF